MTNEQARLWVKEQKKPAYLVLPDDGADFTCPLCKEITPHHRMILPFLLNERISFAQCIDCTDEYWLSRATNLGVAS